MGNFIHDIPSIEAFLALIILMLGIVAMQAFGYRRNLTQDDMKILFQWISKGIIVFLLLAALLLVIAMLIK